MRRLSFLCEALLIPLLFAVATAPVCAQAPLEASQLPARTSFYLIWRGAPAGDARKSNALLSLWDDPDLAPARAAMIDAMMNNAKQQKDKPKLTREQMTEFATLLDNPFTAGYLPKPPSAATKASTTKESSTTKEVPPAWNGLFFVYDRTGKEELLSKAVLRMRASEADIPKLTEVTIAGVKALKIEHKSGTTYWAENGKFAVAASEETVFEEVLNRLAGKSPGGSLAESDAYKEAKPLLSAGLLEFFLRVPQIKDMAGDTGSSTPQIKMLLSALKLDAIHSFAGHITLEGPRTRLQGAVLGDTAEGSLFDIWPVGQAKPATLAFVTPETVYFNESQINLLGIFSTINRAFMQPGSNTAPVVSTLESAAQTRIGMPLTDALALPTGEFATLQNSPKLDPDKKMFLAGITKKPETLKLIRSIYGDQLTSEHTEGDITYLKISLNGNQGTKGVAQWNFYHLALTPNFLLGASKNETLRAALEASPTTGDSALPKNIQAARAQFPGKINSFTYFDFQKLDWAVLKQQWLTESSKATADAKTTTDSPKTKSLSHWMTDVNPAVFPRHLHSLTGGSWKDANGVHFDEWLD